MLLNDLLKQDDGKKVVEDPKFIEFSRRTVRFGDELYQLRNVTGFEVGKIPKDKFPTLIFLVLLLAGLALSVVGIGIILIIIAGYMIYSHLNQVQKYGLILTFNSGRESSFISRDKIFLGNIVSALYQLMEGEIDGITINFQDRSVNIHAPFEGIAATGDNAQNEYRT